MSKLLLVTYDTNHEDTTRTGSIYYWEKSVRKYNWDHIKLGNGEPWLGFGQKLRGLKTALPRIIREYGKDIVIIFTDARDVIANRTKRDFLRKFKLLNAKIVFGTEIGCCVSPMDSYPPGSFITKSGKRKELATAEFVKNNTSKYKNMWLEGMKSKTNIEFEWMRALNSGMYAGYANDILRMLRKMSPVGDNEDDQALWSELMLMYPRTIKLDYNNTLFSNANTWDGKDGCFFTYNKRSKMWRTTKTNTYPYFIQVPGAKQDNFACYKRLTAP
jgi:hypothetical protein